MEGVGGLVYGGRGGKGVGGVGLGRGTKGTRLVPIRSLLQPSLTNGHVRKRKNKKKTSRGHKGMAG